MLQPLFNHSGFFFFFLVFLSQTTSHFFDIPTTAHLYWRYKGSSVCFEVETCEKWYQIRSDKVPRITESKLNPPTDGYMPDKSNPFFFYPLKISNNITLLSGSAPSGRWHKAYPRVGTETQDLQCQMTKYGVTLKGNIARNLSRLPFQHLGEMLMDKKQLTKRTRNSDKKQEAKKISSCKSEWFSGFRGFFISQKIDLTFKLCTFMFCPFTD